MKIVEKMHFPPPGVLAGAFASGLLLTCAFPDIGISVFAFVALAPLFAMVARLSARQAFWAGYAFGCAHFATLIYWVVHTMTVYGGLPMPVGHLIHALFFLFLALYPALFGAVAAKLCDNPGWFPLACAGSWVSFEYLRATLFTGFPWCLLGYSQYRRIGLIQISDVTGVYGISFFIALVNASMVLLIFYAAGLKWKGRPLRAKTALGWAAATAVLFVLIYGYGTVRIRRTDTAAQSARPATVAVLQGNVPQDVKWDPEFTTKTTVMYVQLASAAADDPAPDGRKPDLVVWPETATPFYLFRNPVLTALVERGVKRSGTAHVIGSPAGEYMENGPAYFNSAYLLDRQGNMVGRYDKTHLVPFGEYVPMQRFLPFLGKLVEQVGDFSAGEEGRVLNLDDMALGMQICYEVIFPSLSGNLSKSGANLLVNITNDAWFGRSSAPFQHFSMTVFRAVENKKALVRAANTGISGFVGPSGRIQAVTRLFEKTRLARTLPLMDGVTVYARIGDVFALACILATLFGAWRTRRGGKGENPDHQGV